MPSLEQDAMERVKRMYSSFDRPERGRHPRPPMPPKEPPKEPQNEPPDECPIPQKPPAQNMIELLMKDNERSLILLLIIILMNDGADSMLILALMYIII